MALVQLTELAVRVLCFAGLAALVFAPIEHLWPVRTRAESEPRSDSGLRIGGLRAGFLADLAFATAGQFAARAVLAVGLGFVLAWLDIVGLERPLFAAVETVQLRVGLEIGAGLSLFELGGYGYHRLAHRVPWLWRLHAVHHSSERLDWLASFRQHPLELVLMTLAQNAPLVLLGVPLSSHATVLLLLKLHTVFVHADIAVPDAPWTRVIATPRFHHRHHAASGPTCNYASLFPFIDRVFATRG